MRDTNSIFYKLIYSKLKEKKRKNGKLKIKDINYVMGATFHIPKEYRMRILDEMQDLKLLKLKKRTRIELNEVEIK